MIEPRSIELQLKINNKTIALTPIGIKAMPILTTKELLVALAYLTSMRFSYIWWIGDLFNKSKQYQRVPYSLIKTMFASNNIETPLRNAVSVSKEIPDNERRIEISPLKQNLIRRLFPFTYKHVIQEAIENKWSIGTIIEKGQNEIR